MDKIAIISDIHGNWAGLQAVLADIEGCRCDRIVCLGDLVDGGNFNDEVVRFVRDNQIVCVRGNHDEFNDLDLAEDVRSFLMQLPESVAEDDAVYTHISPRKKKNKAQLLFWEVSILLESPASGDSGRDRSPQRVGTGCLHRQHRHVAGSNVHCCAGVEL
ncbi:MAG: metallophosphoesterase [Oscillatoria princeps RMCB-10]|jgi:predicted phosphodiesterase|nr:metallophosphoesterase [Oscillatoria princeps RMCB-10]